MIGITFSESVVYRAPILMTLFIKYFKYKFILMKLGEGSVASAAAHEMIRITFM